MNHHLLQRRIAAVDAWHVMQTAGLQSALMNLADAQKAVDEAAASEDRILRQRALIEATREGLTASGQRIALPGLTQLHMQHLAASDHLRQCQNASRQNRDERDERQGDVASLRAKVDALERLQKKNLRQLRWQEARREAAQLEDLWVSTKRHEEQDR